MPEHIKVAQNDSEEFNDYLKDFVGARLQENGEKRLEAVRKKVGDAAANIAIMLAG